MTSKLTGKVALITGGSTGIGKAIAQRFATEGAHVIVFGRNKPDYKCEFHNVDVSSEEQIARAMKNVKRLDVLVNNAGTFFEGTVDKTTKEQLDKIVDVNFKGPYMMSKHALPLLRKSKGSIINISSTIGAAPRSDYPAYCSTKAALIMLTKCMTLAHTPEGVRVNAILPGPIETPMLRAVFGSQEKMVEYGKETLMKRIGRPEEIANVAAFLASDEASYVSGGIYAVDGGEMERRSG